MKNSKNTPGSKSTKSKGSKSVGKSRTQAVRLKTARGRKISSTRWLERQLNDPYVQEAKNEGYRSRAAFKLVQINEKFHFLKLGQTIVDLGAAPGGWTQVAVAISNPKHHDNKILALDIQEIDPIPGAVCVQRDIFAEDTIAFVEETLGDKVDVVLSDMSPPTTGHSSTDHIRIIALTEAALEVAIKFLKPGGCFVSKVFKGGTEGELLKVLKAHFKEVKHAKPAASRPESPESYVVALGFRKKI